MPTSRSPKKKVKRAAPPVRKKPVASSKKKPVASSKKKPVASSKKKPVASSKKRSSATPRKKSAASSAKKSVATPRKKSAATPRKKSAATPRKKPADSAGAVFGSQAEFERFLPLAQALPADQVTPLRFDPELAYHNVRVGVRSLEPHRETLKRELSLDLPRLFALPELGQALLFAASQADQHAGAATPAGPSLAALLQEGQKLRGQLLTAAATLAAFGLLPAAAVDKIREGRGSIDSARDLGDLAALYHKHSAAFKKNTPVTAPQVKRAAEVGSALLSRLSPRGSRPSSRAKPPESVADRDRLATLLVRGHRDLRRAGYWIWGDAFDAHVPALLSRPRPHKKPPTLPAPLPPPAPAPPA